MDPKLHSQFQFCVVLAGAHNILLRFGNCGNENDYFLLSLDNGSTTSTQCLFVHDGTTSNCHLASVDLSIRPSTWIFKDDVCSQIVSSHAKRFNLSNNLDVWQDSASIFTHKTRILRTIGTSNVELDKTYY